MSSLRCRRRASMIANARWTTTSAPFTASRTLLRPVTSPWRYSVFFQPGSAGSNGRRAIPTIFFTSPRALQRGDERDAEVAGRAGDRDRQSVVGHGAVISDRGRGGDVTRVTFSQPRSLSSRSAITGPCRRRTSRRRGGRRPRRSCRRPRRCRRVAAAAPRDGVGAAAGDDAVVAGAAVGDVKRPAASRRCGRCRRRRSSSSLAVRARCRSPSRARRRRPRSPCRPV